MSRVGVDLILPPLIQGIPLFHISSTSVHGFIPAHAGNTSLQRNRPWPWKVHPRSRGEYIGLFSKQIAYRGSPPLTRGIHFLQAKPGFFSRFTPAHAGNTFMRDITLCHPRVHPRSRGEYKLIYTARLTQIGSPPLTRGIH